MNLQGTNQDVYLLLFLAPVQPCEDLVYNFKIIPKLKYEKSFKTCGTRGPGKHKQVLINISTFDVV